MSRVVPACIINLKKQNPKRNGINQAYINNAQSLPTLAKLFGKCSMLLSPLADDDRP